MAVRDDRGDVKQTTTVFRGPLMVQSLTSAKSKFLSLLPNPLHRRGRTYDFAKYIGDKYNIPVKYKPLSTGQKFDYMSQKDFVKMWSPYLYNFNLDPIPIHPGGQCIQVASVGSINIGGLNEAHHILYPETATCDEKILEDRFVEYLNNPTKRFEVIQNAWNKLNEIYSFSNVKSQLEMVYKKIK